MPSKAPQGQETVLGMYLLMLLLPLIDPGKANYQNFQKVYGIIRIVFVAYMAAIYAATLFAAFGHSVNMTTVILPLVGVLLIVLGNFLGKIRPNWFVGVRTPWTLSSDRVWARTHRVGGWCMAAAGLLLILAAAAPSAWFLWLFLVGVVGASLVPVVYSYVAWRQEHRA